MKKYKKKIIFFSSNRSDYDLLKPLIDQLKKNNKIILKLLVSGSHLKSQYGFTYSKISENHKKISKKIYLNSNSDNSKKLSNYISEGIKKYSNFLNNEKPDFSIILGDRSEAFAFGIACYSLNVPIGHIHGGEITEGSLDDGFRHSLTKLSNLHFVTNNIYKKRVIQLGENPKVVHNVGSLAEENIFNYNYLTKSETQNKLKMNFGEKNLIVSFHSETNNLNYTIKNFKELLKAIDYFKKIQFIFTCPNNDPGGLEILKIMKNFIKNKKNCFFYKSLGQELFFSCIKYSNGIIGNSSSGILEIPYLKKATINIGIRQKGRLFKKSVINSKAKKSEIIKSINYIFNPNYNKILIKNNIKKKDTSAKISNIIVNYLKNKKTNKIFFDLKKY